jgi:putative transposase
LSYWLVQNFGVIAVEDLNIKGLSAGILAKAVHDAGSSSFIHMLDYKAENAGRQVIKVDAKYTSQECPQCGALEKKHISERVHQCDCGLTLHRDHAAAFVILGRGLRLHARTKPELRASVA